jgi:hypothetical protein
MLYIKLNYISMMANNVHMQMSPAKENYSRRYIGKTLKALKGQFLIKRLRSFFAAGLYIKHELIMFVTRNIIHCRRQITHAYKI